MDIERALETQRHALLRLLAGLVMAVEFVSRGPFQGALPRWVQSFIHSILRRAEEAAQCLVTVTVWVLTKNGVTVPSSSVQRSARAENTGDDAAPEDGRGDEELPKASPDDLLPTDSLRQRMQAMQDMVEDLPGHALRLMRKRAGQRIAKHPTVMFSDDRTRDLIQAFGGIQRIRLLTPRIERPPDRSLWHLRLQSHPQLPPACRGGDVGASA